MNSTKVFGTFVNVSDAAILFQNAGQETVQRQDVRSVMLTTPQHRLRNTLLGLAIGFGAGAAIGVATSSSKLSLNGDAGALIGSIGGTVVGAVWPDYKTIYRVKAQ